MPDLTNSADDGKRVIAQKDKLCRGIPGSGPNCLETSDIILVWDDGNE